MDVVAELTVGPETSIYFMGWQSWSISGRVPFGQSSPLPRDPHNRAHFHRDDAPTPDTSETAVVQSDGGLLAVDPGNGQDVIVFSAPTPDQIPVIRATRRRERTLEITSTGPCATAAFPGSLDEALSVWAASWLPEPPDRVPGDSRHPSPPAGWNTWYSYKRRFNLDTLDVTMDIAREHDLPIDVIQIDDGYFHHLGDWLTVRETLGGSADAMSKRVRDRGFQFGLWLCPTLADVNSDIVAQRPELWVEGVTAPFGSNRTVRVLDPTAPGAADYIADLFGTLTTSASWFKLDFLWTAGLPGPRHSGLDPIGSYRETLRLIRDAVHDDTWLIGCGAPILASVGTGLDAVRTTPDVGRTWEPDKADLTQPSGRSSVDSGRARAFLHPHLLRADPDVSLLGLDVEHRERILHHVASQPGSLRVCGDRLPELANDPWALDMTRRVLTGETTT